MNALMVCFVVALLAAIILVYKVISLSERCKSLKNDCQVFLLFQNEQNLKIDDVLYGFGLLKTPIKDDYYNIISDFFAKSIKDVFDLREAREYSSGHFNMIVGGKLNNILCHSIGKWDIDKLVVIYLSALGKDKENDLLLETYEKERDLIINSFRGGFHFISRGKFVDNLFPKIDLLIHDSTPSRRTILEGEKIRIREKLNIKEA